MGRYERRKYKVDGGDFHCHRDNVAITSERNFARTFVKKSCITPSFSSGILSVGSGDRHVVTLSVSFNFAID